MRIVIDSREKHPYAFAEASAITKKLDAGDYGLEGFEDQAAVERKSLDDFVKTVIYDRDRFHRELQRLAPYRFKAVVVEASLKDLLAGKYQSGAAPAAVLGAAVSIIVDWNIPVFFCGSRQAAIAFTETWLRRVHRRLKT